LDKPKKPTRHEILHGPEVESVVAKWRELIGQDPTCSAAREWIARRLRLLPMPAKSEGLATYSLDELLLAVGRYGEQVRRERTEKRYACRNFFGTFAYCEEFLRPGWTAPPSSQFAPHTAERPYKAEPVELPSPLPANLAPAVSVWGEVRAVLDTVVDPENFKTWIKPLACLGQADGVLYLQAPLEFHASWIRRNFAEQIAELAHMPVDVRAKTPGEEGSDDE